MSTIYQSNNMKKKFVTNFQVFFPTKNSLTCPLQNSRISSSVILTSLCSCIHAQISSPLRGSGTPMTCKKNYKFKFYFYFYQVHHDFGETYIDSFDSRMSVKNFFNLTRINIFTTNNNQFFCTSNNFYQTFFGHNSQISILILNKLLLNNIHYLSI